MTVFRPDGGTCVFLSTWVLSGLQHRQADHGRRGSRLVLYARASRSFFIFLIFVIVVALCISLHPWQGLMFRDSPVRTRQKGHSFTKRWALGCLKFLPGFGSDIN